MRSVTIYRFELERKGEKMSMPVLTNPYVSRLIRQMGYDIIKEDADTKSA
jgi:hypothetical protein